MHGPVARKRRIIKPLFIQGPSIALRLVVLSLLSIVMMTLDHRQHHMDNVRAALSIVVYPLQYLVTAPQRAGGWLAETLASRIHLLEENHGLHTRQLLLETRLQKLEALEAENERLRELLDSSSKVQERVLIARLLTVDMAPFSRQITLNKGSSHQVFRGQPVLDAKGVVGQLVTVTPLTSTAMLITDPNHAIPVAVNRNGMRAIAVGTGESNRLELMHIPNNADIVEGDLLVTSGLGGRFPPGYPVARVTSVVRDPGEAFAAVTAEPTAALESTREVLLVWSGMEQPAQQAAGRE